MNKKQDISDIKLLLYTNKNILKDTIRSVLTKLGLNIEYFQFTEDLNECLKLLEQIGKGIFVLDWTVNLESSLQFLRFIKSKQLYSDIYIFIVSQQLDDKVIAISTEYFVAKVHSGDITQNKIELFINDIINQMRALDPIQSSLNKAVEARKALKFEESIAILKALLDKHPDNSRIIVELAENYILSEQWQNAMDLLAGLQEMEPVYVRAIHLYGKCLIKFKKYKQAIDVLNKAKLISPYNVDRLLLLGSTHLKLGEVDEAKENFNQALQYMPNDKHVKQAMGTCLLTEGELNSGLALLREVATVREIVSIFNSAAILNVRLQRLDDALKLYDTAVDIVNDEAILKAKLFYNKGIAYYKFNKQDKAIESFEQALKLDPLYSNAKHNLNVLTNKLSDTQVNLYTKDEDLVFDFEDSELNAFQDDLSQEDKIL